jgi:hypothetical protein
MEAQNYDLLTMEMERIIYQEQMDKYSMEEIMIPSLEIIESTNIQVIYNYSLNTTIYGQNKTIKNSKK